MIRIIYIAIMDPLNVQLSSWSSSDVSGDGIVRIAWNHQANAIPKKVANGIARRADDSVLEP